MDRDTLVSIGEQISHADLTSGQLDYLSNCVKSASQRRARKLRQSLAVGDRVRIHAAKPKYLIGMEATVEGKRGTKVEIMCDFQPQGSRFGRKLIIPATCLEPISD